MMTSSVLGLLQFEGASDRRVFFPGRGQELSPGVESSGVASLVDRSALESGSAAAWTGGGSGTSAPRFHLLIRSLHH